MRHSSLNDANALPLLQKIGMGENHGSIARMEAVRLSTFKES